MKKLTIPSSGKSCKVKLQVVWIPGVVEECYTGVILDTSISIMWWWVVEKGAS